MKGLIFKPGLFCCLFFLAVTTDSYSQGKSGDSFFVDPSFSLDRWTVENGLPVNSINDIEQTPDGYLWLATFDGLVRFDGVRFKVFKSAEYPGLPSNRIIDMEFTSDGTVWMRLENEKLVRFTDGAFQQVGMANGLKGELTYCFYKQENSGDLWICTENGISVYSKGKLRPFYPEIITELVSHVYVDESGVVWYKDNESLNLYRFDGSQKTLVATSSGVTIPSPFLTLNKNRTIFSTNGHIYEYKNGMVTDLVPNLPEDFQVLDFFVNDSSSAILDGVELIVASLTRGLFKLSGNSLSLINSEFTGNKMTVFLPADDNLWSVGENHVLFNNRIIFSFDNRINDMAYDREGSFWFGSESAGLFRLKPNLFTIYSEEEGAPNKNIYPVFEAADGSIWFGTHGYGAAKLKDGVISRFEIEYPLPGNQFVRSIIETSSGELLISLYGEGLYKLNAQNQTFELTSTPESTTSSARLLSILSLFEDSQQRLWAGSSHGLFWKKNREWHQVPSHHSNPEFPVRYIAEAPDSSLWMATAGGGIQHYRNGTFTTYTQENGLSSNLVRSFHIDTVSVSDGYILWIGTENKGLNRLVVSDAGPQFETIITYSEETGLYDNVVHQILADGYDRFWMSGNKGIYRVSRKQLTQFADKKINTIRSTAYTEKDGLRNREANGGVQPAGIKSSDGRIWFPTQDGVVSVDPENITRNEVPPPVMVEEVRSNEDSISPEEGKIVLTANQRDFEVNYTGLSFMVPEKVRFRYRLKGFNEEWIEAGTRRTAFYTNVPPGHYEFEVLAANNEGVWSSEPATASIEVLPYFYETNFFYLSAILVLGGLVFLFVQIRIRNLKKRERILEQSVKERTTEIENQKEIIELQAEAQKRFFTNVSHELRTPLTLTIGPLEDLKGKDNGNGLQEKVSSKVSLALRNAKRLLSLVSEILDVSRLEASENKVVVSRHDLATFTKAIAQNFISLANRKNINYSINTPDTLEAWFNEDQIEKVITNLLSNAFKFSEDESEISVTLKSNNKQAIIEVRDSGMGIPKEELPFIFDRFYQSDNLNSRLQHGTGIGLALVKHLVELHGGSIEAESTLGKGTTFTITLLLDAHTLPYAEIEEAPSLITSAARPVVDGEEISKLENSSKLEQEDHTTILVVEDNLELRQFVADHLRAGYRVIEAVHGKEGLKKTKEFLPDLIVSDVMMPEMDGFEFVEQLREDESVNFIPVILLTGKDTKEDTVKGLEYGADDYIVKPFNMDELKARIKSILRSQKLLQAHFEKDALLISIKKEQLKSADQEFLENVQHVIQQKLGDSSLSVEKLAELVNVDRSTLHRKLTAITGEKPVQLIRRLRLEQARHMIENGAGTVSEIAYAVGFESISWFSKCFKEQFGRSPSELQK